MAGSVSRANQIREETWRSHPTEESTLDLRMFVERGNVVRITYESLTALLNTAGFEKVAVEHRLPREGLLS
jgi:hypothetical protein